jgi:CubicO group peptidase (beta-lactamase class C family)
MLDWTEHEPSQAGIDRAALSRALVLIQRRRASAQICVLQNGRVILDRAFGCCPDDLFWIFSTSKPFAALLVHLLAERGALSLDDAVASHWPEFARNGKDAITIRQVLQHRSGLPVARSAAEDALVMTDWNRSVGNIEQARVRYLPGQVPAYHYLSYGFILGELVRRVTGRSVPDVLTAELLRPLGLHDIHLGLPGDLWPRHVNVRGQDPAGWITQAVVNRRRTRQAIIPAAGISATARDVARFYRALLQGGELDGARVLQPATIMEATQPSSNGEVDRFVRLPIRWSQGFQLGGPALGRPASHPMGERSSRETFGHNGSDTCLAWADPARQLVMVYLTSLLSPGRQGARHLSEVSDAVLSACG